MVNLTKMWRAWQREEKDAGVIRAHRPAEFKRIHETIKLMEYLKKILKVGEAHLWITAKCKHGGTYAHRAKPVRSICRPRTDRPGQHADLSYLSPAFRMWANEVLKERFEKPGRRLS